MPTAIRALGSLFPRKVTKAPRWLFVTKCGVREDLDHVMKSIHGKIVQVRKGNYIFDFARIACFQRLKVPLQLLL